MMNSSIDTKEVLENKTLITDIFLYDQIRLPGYAVPDWIFSLLMKYISFAMITVSVFGTTGNILIIITFVKIGFAESINISYLSLCIADILCVLTLTWNAICFIPEFANANLPFVASEMVIPTGGGMGDIFCGTTACITAFISLERCLCVVIPLKIKTIAKRTNTIRFIISIFGTTILPLTGVTFFIYSFDISFLSGMNRTLIRVSYRNSTLTDPLYEFHLMYKLVVVFITPLLVTLVCSVYLAIHLNRSALWRLGHSDTTKARVGSKISRAESLKRKKYMKDIRVAQTVLAIATAFILLGSLSVIRFMVSMAWPKFRPMGAYARSFRLTARMSYFFSLTNSSLNFIIYYRMGTKFKRTVNEILFGRDKK